MSSTIKGLNLKRYRQLLARAVPKVIKTEEEHERAVASLIHDFEEKAYPILKSEPNEMVAFLPEQRGLAPKDLWPVIGSRAG